jgi:hypothetical protein
VIRTVLFVTLAVVAFSTPRMADAQQPVKIPCVGILSGSTATTFARYEPLRQGLREHGYVEGKNIVLESPTRRLERERIADRHDEVTRPGECLNGQASRSEAPCH